MSQNGARQGRQGAVLEPHEAAHVLALLHILGATGCAAMSLSAFVSHDARVGYIAGSGSCVFLLLFVLTRLGHTKAAGVLGSFFLPALATLSMVTGNGVRDLSLPAFSFNMLLANLVLSARASLLVTIGTCLSVTGAAAAEWLGWFSTPLSFRTNGAAVMVILIMHIALAFAARRL